MIILLVTITIVSVTIFFIFNGVHKTGRFLEEYSTEVVAKVLDGDTIELTNGEKVRLLEIDTPEKNFPCYKEAKDFLKFLVEGKEVKLEKNGEDKDKYGRLLRYVYVGNVLVNLELVRNGYAVVYSTPRERYYNQLKIAEEEAKEKQLCLWKTSEFKCIVVSEFHFNANGNDNENLNDEYVVFENNCNYPINMNRWTVNDEGNIRYVFKNFTLEGKSNVTLYSGSGKDTKTELYWNNKKYAIWNNQGDTLYLRDDKGNLVLDYSYIGY